MLDDASDPKVIGARIRRERERRGLSLSVAAQLAGIPKSTLGNYETGVRRIVKRKTLEDIACALNCMVTEITGEPYDYEDDPVSSRALATLPPISAALLDCTFDDVPDVPARPVDLLARLARAANAASADSRYSIAGRDLGALLTELHVHVVTGSADHQRAALAALPRRASSPWVQLGPSVILILLPALRSGPRTLRCGLGTQCWAASQLCPTRSCWAGSAPGAERDE